MPKLSIVIPVFNEENNLHPLYSRLCNILNNTGLGYEIIFVDDGSTDNSLNVISDISQNDTNTKYISFSRNFGHMIAISAGLDYATGDAVITLDADLQHPPELIPELIKKWQAGAQIINTVRKEARGIGILKKLSSIIYYWLIKKIANLNLTPNTADFRLMDRSVVETLKGLKERSRFLRGLIVWIGFKQEFIDYQADTRLSGKTKYSLPRMFSFALDGITSFSSFPLRFSAYLGFFVALSSFIYIVYALYIKLFTNQAIQGWTSVVITVLFIGGIQLIFLGIIGEYLSRVYEETKQRPLYIIKKKSGI